MPKAARPCWDVSSFRSPSSCRTMGVDERLRPKPATSAAATGRPASRPSPASTSVVMTTCAAPRHEDHPAQREQPAGLQLEADDEEQDDHAELGEVQDALHVGHEPEAEGPDEHAAGEVGQHRAQPEAPEQRHGDHRRRQEQRDLGEQAGHRLGRREADRLVAAVAVGLVLRRPAPAEVGLLHLVDGAPGAADDLQRPLGLERVRWGAA